MLSHRARERSRWMQPLLVHRPPSIRRDVDLVAPLQAQQPYPHDHATLHHAYGLRDASHEPRSHSPDCGGFEIHCPLNGSSNPLGASFT